MSGWENLFRIGRVDENSDYYSTYSTCIQSSTYLSTSFLFSFRLPQTCEFSNFPTQFIVHILISRLTASIPLPDFLEYS